MTANLDARVTGAQAGALIGVSRQLIHDWWKRDLLSKGDDGLYRYGDVLEAERRTRRTKHAGTWRRGGPGSAARSR